MAEADLQTGEIVTPYTIKLITPVDGVTEITLRELTIDELARFRDQIGKFGEVRATKNLIGELSKVEIATIGRLGVRDFNACSKYIGTFKADMEDAGDAPLETPHTIELITPVDGVTEVTLREPSADEYARFGDDIPRVGEIRAMKNIVAALSKVEPAIVGRMYVRDFAAFNQYLAPFFG